MKGVALEIDKKDKYLDITITPKEIEGVLDEKTLVSYIRESEFADLYIFDENVSQVFNAYKAALKEDTKEPLVERIGERRDAEIKFTVSSDEMTATLQIVSPYGGKKANMSSLKAKARHANVMRGLSTKRMKKMVMEAKDSAPGSIFEELIAKGLPPKNGRPSKLNPLVPNALERILRPQETDTTQVDMRDLGDIICVKVGTPVLERLPPSLGRTGFSVTGTVLERTPGEWQPLKPGEGTSVDATNENILIAEITGMPKFQKEKMWVDDSFICKGVNVGSGNVKYDGAVLVNGDVTEKMVINATGDVTINGFVESATIIAGGDIIITQGAMGKQDEKNNTYSTKLTAQGSVHVQHGQGLDITCNGNVTVGKQLAYSRIVCTGGVIVGPIDNPNGNLFSCDIQSQNAILAGTLGAVSGSNLSIDFSEGFNNILNKKDVLEDLLAQISKNSAVHFERMNVIKKKLIPEELRAKVSDTMDKFESEQQLMAWLEEKVDKIRKAKDQYVEDAFLAASKNLYPGVVVKLNKRVWRAEREYNSARIHFHEHQWQFDPL